MKLNRCWFLSRGCLAVTLVVASLAKLGAEEPFANVPCQCQPTECTQCGDGLDCEGCLDWFKKTPVRKTPRPGNFPIPPTGCGYYSLRDFVTDTPRKAAPKAPYAPISPMVGSFFDSDFRYLADPENTQTDVFDFLHPICLTDNLQLSTGGEFRIRYMNETDSRLSGRTNDYNLYRTRVYGDLWYKDSLRLFVEYLHADSGGEELNPLGIDINRSDLLNAFVEAKLGEVNKEPLYLRVGRQELLLGSQRLVSPLDWANTRRTFQGARLSRPGKEFDFDFFWVQPVIPNRNRFDSVDNDQNFAGAWTTYKPKKGHFLDLYYLFLDDTSPRRLLGEPAAVAFNTHTIGARYAGNKDNFLWDVEGMVQLGSRGNDSIYGTAASVGGGYNFKCAPFNPTLWVYYDYASGDDNNPGSGFTTFNQQFPFGHYYLGWVDQVGRQNIHDVNAHLFLYPAKWITVWMQYHNFHLANSRDALYNAGGIATRRDPTGMSGSHVGNEIDLILNFHLGPHSDILLGYSKLFAGDFLDNTAGGQSPELFFATYSVRW